MSDQQAPKQIYLQAYDSDSYDDNTWCVDRINDEDIEYILQSEYDQLKAENDQLRAENEQLREGLEYIVNRGYTGASYVAQQAMKEVKK